jgi:prepilin-type N-terminal cleavage/methylation domain-containing protein
MRRLGFTLIEVLVVIAIIAILAALLLGGVMAFMKKGPEMVSKSDIQQLSTSLDQFKGKFKQYPPSQIVLRSTISSYNMGNKLEADSVNWIMTLWPNISTTKVLQWAPGFVGPATLEGDQSLVLFLGGPPNGSGGVSGWSTDPTDPTNPATVDRVKFYDFPPGRLTVFPNATGTRGPFPSYVDGWGKLPYIYFGSGKKADGYDPLLALGFPTKVTAFNKVVTPYYATAATATAPPSGYFNSTKFQLISAGRDATALPVSGGFGPGGLWPPFQPPEGLDDICNFNNDKVLGTQ